MKSLFFHTLKYSTKVTGLSTRPAGIEPELSDLQEKNSGDCVSVWVTIEDGDTAASCDQLFIEIEKMCKDIGRDSVVLVPFAHLSNNLAKPAEALVLIKYLESKISTKFKIIKEHFGSDKELFLHVAGHPGNVRYREF